MKIWLLEEGERTGPHESFEIRERIAAGDLGASTQAWYEGAPDWVRLDEVPVLQSEFVSKDSYQETDSMTATSALEVAEQEQIALEYIHPPKLHMARRFFARFFDMWLYLALLMLILKDPTLLKWGERGVFWHLMMGLGYVLIDGGMTNAWKCSPGKWLLGLRVVNFQGKAIGLAASVLRSLRVWVLGWGMWLITPVALAVSWFMAKRLNYFVWDFPKRYRVVCEPLTTGKILSVIIAYMGLYALIRLAIPPEVVQEMQEEWLKRYQ